MSYGDFPDIPNDYSNGSMLLPAGVILGGDLKKIHDVDLKAPDQVQEWVTHSWYKYAQEQNGLHPFDGVTDPASCSARRPRARAPTSRTSTRPPSTRGQVAALEGARVEVGPLARYLVAYARGNKEIQEQVNGTLNALDVPITALFSTLGRTAARGLECQWSAHKMRYFYDQLIANIKAGDLATANVENGSVDVAEGGEGVAPCEAPRERSRTG